MPNNDSPERLAHLEAIDRDHIWHPYTQMSEYPGALPQIIVERGEGVFVYDIHGKRYLDGYSQMWCNSLGHARKEINDAIKAQLDRIAHSTLFSASNRPSVELAERMVAITKREFAHTNTEFPHVFFSDNGSTAVEVALKIAIQYHTNLGREGRNHLLCFSDAYHGDTAATMTLGGVDLFRRAYAPLTFHVERTHYPMAANSFDPADPDETEAYRDAIEELEKMFEQRADSLAAVVIEPGAQGAGGMRPLHKGFLQHLRQLCDQHDVLLIADEVLVAFGRGGHWFSSAGDSVAPDLLCIAKALTAGYVPLALTLATGKVFDAFKGKREEFKHLFHGHTFTGNQVGCATALATMDVMEEIDLVGHVGAVQPHMVKRLRELAELDVVGRVRHRGMMMGIPLHDPSGSGDLGYGGTFGARVCKRALEKGVIIRPLGDIVVLMPISCSSIEELDLLFDATRDSIIEESRAG